MQKSSEDLVSFIRSVQAYYGERVSKIEATAFGSKADVSGHTDVVVVLGDTTLTVDVKGAKAINRADTEANLDRLLIEHTNVRGDTGWVRIWDEHHYVAWDLGAEWLIVKTSDLMVLCRDVQWEFRHKGQGYTKDFLSYGRADRLDKFCYVPTTALNVLPSARRIPKI